MVEIRSGDTVWLDGREIGAIGQLPAGRATRWAALAASKRRGRPGEELFDVVGEAPSKRAAAQILVDLATP